MKNIEDKIVAKIKKAKRVHLFYWRFPEYWFGKSYGKSVGKILFKKSAPKNLSAIGEISGLVIQALKEIGKGNVTESEIQIILKQFAKEEPYRLEHDML